MSRLFQLAVKTHEARISESGDGYVAEVTKYGKMHANPETCILNNLNYIITHPRQEFTLMDYDEDEGAIR